MSKPFRLRNGLEKCLERLTKPFDFCVFAQSLMFFIFWTFLGPKHGLEMRAVWVVENQDLEVQGGGTVFQTP